MPNAPVLGLKEPNESMVESYVYENPDTGERVAWNGKDWIPIPKASAQLSTAQKFVRQAAPSTIGGAVGGVIGTHYFQGPVHSPAL